MYSFEKNLNSLNFSSQFAHCVHTHTHSICIWIWIRCISMYACVYVRAHRSLLHHRIILWHCVYRHLFLSNLFCFRVRMCICFICFLAMCAVCALYSRSTNNGTFSLSRSEHKFEKRSCDGNIQERKKNRSQALNQYDQIKMVQKTATTKNVTISRECRHTARITATIKLS